MPRLDIQLSPQNEIHSSVVLSLPDQSVDEVLPRDFKDAVLELSRDPGVKEAIGRSREFQLHDSALYFSNAIERIFNTDYVPNNQDILRSHAKTVGISEAAFEVGNLKYKLLDVGQQWVGHKKWIHCFESVKALIFSVNLNDYDQMLYKDGSVVGFISFLLCTSRL